VRALLLAAGRGSRLGEVSKSTPKCLQRVGGMTVLDRLVTQLIAVGVDEFLINTHHLSEQVHRHVAESEWGSRARLVHEPTLLGTLGTLRANLDFFGRGSGWVLHADNVVEGSLIRLRGAFDSRPVAAWGCMLAMRVRCPSDYGVVTVGPQGLMSGFFEKVNDPPSDLASAAIFVFGSTALDVVRGLPEANTDISREFMPLLAGHIQVVVHEKEVVDIGTPDNLAYARRLID
jgi:mannose-1-phosphate guanylyltransferase